MDRKGTLYGVSVGPGDPELMTLKAVRIIGECDAVAVPNIGHKRQTAYAIAEKWLDGKRIIDCATPMTRDHDEAMRAYAQIAQGICAELDEGHSVAYLVLGDATIYSTYLYIHDIVIETGYQARIVAGVPSFCAAAAKLGIALCEGPERLVVAPVAGRDTSDVLDAEHATLVLMKTGKDLPKIKDDLAQRGLLEHASMVANCGLPDEKVFERFADADDEKDYFSVVIVRKPTLAE